MIDVHEIIRRSRAGDSARKIAQATHINRKTVGRYLHAAATLLPSPTSELTDDLIRAIKQEVQARAEDSTGAKMQALERHRERIEKWLNDEKEPLTLIRIHELLRRDGVDVGYTTLRQFAREKFGFGRRPNTVLVSDSGPGEEAQVDFGLMGKVRFDGVERRLWVFIVTLVHSRYSFVWPTFTPTTNDVIAALEAAWRHFGGICRRVIPDNATSMVVKANPLAPELGRVFREYSLARDFIVDPARVESPQDKGRVENHVPYVRERWFAGETFSSLEQAREHAQSWCREVAGMRNHGTTRKQPRVAFEAVEQPMLACAPTERYCIPRWTSATVHRDHHFQVDKALYSVPTAHIGHKVEVRISSSTVIAYRDDQVIATHSIAQAGERRTNPDHYPKHQRTYATRDVNGVISSAGEHGTHVEAFVVRLLSGDFTWTKMRQANALIGLCERYGSVRINHACADALRYDVIDVQRLKKVVTSALKRDEEAVNTGQLIPLPGRFARPLDRFATIGQAHSSNPSGGQS